MPFQHLGLHTRGWWRDGSVRAQILLQGRLGDGIIEALRDSCLIVVSDVVSMSNVVKNIHQQPRRLFYILASLLLTFSLHTNLSKPDIFQIGLPYYHPLITSQVSDTATSKPPYLLRFSKTKPPQCRDTQTHTGPTTGSLTTTPAHRGQSTVLPETEYRERQT